MIKLIKKIKSTRFYLKNKLQLLKDQILNYIKTKIKINIISKMQ